MEIKSRNWFSVVGFLAGLWLILSPSILSYSNLSQAVNNDIIVGVTVAVLSAISFFLNRSTKRFIVWLIALVGLWQINSPFVLGYSNNSIIVANAVIIALVIIVTSVVTSFGGETVSQGFSSSYTSEMRRGKRERQPKEEKDNEKF
jgi:hypothetical protein